MHSWSAYNSGWRGGGGSQHRVPRYSRTHYNSPLCSQVEDSYRFVKIRIIIIIKIIKIIKPVLRGIGEISGASMAMS